MTNLLPNSKREAIEYVGLVLLWLLVHIPGYPPTYSDNIRPFVPGYPPSFDALP